MPKMKTHRGAAKRFKRTGSGKIKFKHANMRHNLGSRSKKSKRELRQTGILKECDAGHIRRLLPND